MSFIIDAPKYGQEVLTRRTAFNDRVEALTKTMPTWDESPSPAEYRKWRAEGTNGFDAPVLDPMAYIVGIPSRYGTHTVSVRCISPPSASKGLFLHFHGGGFVVGSASANDEYLRELATKLSLTAVSVEYRLAPEHPYPAGAEDCLSAALYCLSDEGIARFQGPLRVIGGDSAGAYLALWTTLRLRERGVDVKEKITSLVLNYGIYDLGLTPSVRAHERSILLSKVHLQKFIDATFPPGTIPTHMLRSPEYSPLYANLACLPPAFFMVGTEDPLLDDSLFLASRYYTAGNMTHLRIEAAAPHAFTIMRAGELRDRGVQAITAFLNSQVHL